MYKHENFPFHTSRILDGYDEPADPSRTLAHVFRNCTQYI